MSAAMTEKYRNMLACSGDTYSFGPFLGPGPASILLVALFAVSPSLISSLLDSPPPILMKTTQSMIKSVPNQSLHDIFCFFQKKKMMMVKTHVEEKMEEIMPGLMPLFSANINE